MVFFNGIISSQISELLTAANADQGVVSKVEEIIREKNDTINELHAELQRIKGAYSYTTHAYKSKLALYGIPIDELGFIPADSN